MTVHQFPIRTASPSVLDLVSQIGHAHYRRVGDDLIEAGAILRCAVLLLADLAEGAKDPGAALDKMLLDFRGDAIELLGIGS